MQERECTEMCRMYMNNWFIILSQTYYILENLYFIMVDRHLVLAGVSVERVNKCVESKLNQIDLLIISSFLYL